MDAFKDLWDSAAPTSAQQQAQKSQSLNAAAAAAQASAARSAYKGPDSFALLSSAPGSRSLTPALATQRPTSAASQTKPQPARTGNGDAFRDLMSFGGGGSGSQTLSLADRQAKIEQERREKELKQHEEYKSQGAFWDKFGGESLLQPTPVPAATTSRSSTPANLPMRFSPSPVHKPSPNPVAAVAASNGFDLLDFDTLGAPPAPALSNPSSKPSSSGVSPSPTPAADPFDFTAFEDPPSRTDSLTVPSAPAQRSSTPGSFDFGDREDRGSLDNDNDEGAGEEDNILGALSRPVEDRARQEDTRPQPSQSPHTARNPPRSGAVSPPPHVIGQIVEMGFTPQQARFALATTESGLDVQAALDTLLAQQAALEPEPEREHRPERVLQIEHDSDEEAQIAAALEQERRRRRRQGPTRQTLSPSSSSSDSRFRNTGSPHPHLGDENRDSPKLQEQADRLVAQASEFGLNMFNRANALWKQGREQVQKAYEERKVAQGAVGGGRGGGGAASGRSAGPGGGRGRPKWMAEEGRAPWDEPASPVTPTRAHEGGGFRDEDEDSASSPRPEEATRSRPPAQPELWQERPPERREAVQPRPPQERRPEREMNLFGEDGPAEYVSPARRRRPAEAAATGLSARSSPGPQATAAPPQPKPKPAPKPKPVRPTVGVPPAAQAASETHKTKGTELFKLGQFGEAEASYSRALEALPEGCSVRVALLNNRAAARLKTGHSAGVVEDSSAVVALLAPGAEGGDFKPDMEDDWEGVKVADALVKALSRRAEAYEMGEKWEKAAQDWQRVVGLGTGIGKARWDIANRGLERCKRLKDGQEKGETAVAAAAAAPPEPKPKPKPKPVSLAAPSKPSEAVTRLQEANQQQDEEENQRAQLKDSVDARLIAWKGGKETNIRALISSLDTVLWEELQWKKVNLGELVTPGQVKAKYVRAIGRLHPDKLSAMNVTVEHKMIANGVFGALNDAWNAFQQQG